MKPARRHSVRAPFWKRLWRRSHSATSTAGSFARSSARFDDASRCGVTTEPPTHVASRGRTVQKSEQLMSDLLGAGVWAIMESRRLRKTAEVLVRELRERHRRHHEKRVADLMTLSEATDAFSRRRRAIVVRLVRQRGATTPAA